MPEKKLTVSDIGVDVGNVVALEDVGGGVAGLPAIDGSRLLNLPSGDVIGPNSSIDGNLAAFDGTSGKILKQVAPIDLPISTATQDALDLKADTSSLAAIATSGSASDLDTGTIPDDRFPSTLPAVSGANLTDLNASNVASGTLDPERIEDDSLSIAKTSGLQAALDSKSPTLPVSITGTGSIANSGTSALTAFTGSGTSSGTNTGDQTNITGNAGSATALQTAHTISISGDLTYTSPAFDGTANVTAAGTLATVATAGTTGSSAAIPVITIDAKGRTTSITTAAVVAPAGTLTGTTLASNVVNSSLTSVGTLTVGGTGAGFTVDLSTSTVGGTLPAANLGALTGDVTKTAGSNTTTLVSIPAISGANLTAVPSNAALYPTLNQNTTGTAAGLSATLAVGSGGTGQISFTNGQVLIGNTTGNTLTKATLTGTANQITVTNGAGSITLSTPQDIGTGSSVVFAALQAPTINGSTSANGSLTIQGTTNSTRTTSYVNLQPNGGFVGIGTTTPGYVLHAVGSGVAGLFSTSGSSNDGLYVQSTASNGYSSIGFLSSSGSAFGSFGYGNTGSVYADKVFFSANNKAMVFSTTNGSSIAVSIATTGVVSLLSDLVFSTAGKGLQLKSGTNARGGNATLVAGTVTVSNTTVTANTLVTLTRKTAGGTLGNLTYTLSAGSSFTINSDSALDTSVVTYVLVELN